MKKNLSEAITSRVAIGLLAALFVVGGTINTNATSDSKYGPKEEQMTEEEKVAAKEEEIHERQKEAAKTIQAQAPVIQA